MSTKNPSSRIIESRRRTFDQPLAHELLVPLERAAGKKSDPQKTIHCHFHFQFSLSELNEMLLDDLSNCVAMLLSSWIDCTSDNGTVSELSPAEVSDADFSRC